VLFRSGIILFLGIIILFIIRLYKRTKTALGDEHLSSREFWMFMGSMFLILSLIQVFSGTSIPVFNKLFGYKTGIPVAADYNRVQLWMAMPIMALRAIGQYFSYRESNTKLIFKQVIITFSTALMQELMRSSHGND
jgi:cytochrome c-type biogenesis protein CcmF